MEQRRRRVAILGGGIGSLMTAFWMTSEPNWQSRFDITLYQLGWRLGGKCASSRDERFGHRIEEHGLHVWYGWYANAFRSLRACYAELKRPPGNPLRSVEDGFSARPNVQILDEWPPGSDTWSPLNFDMPLTPGVPGVTEPEVRFWPVVTQILQTMAKLAGRWIVEVDPRHGLRGWLHRLFLRLMLIVLLGEWLILGRALRVARHCSSDSRRDAMRQRQRLSRRTTRFGAWVRGELARDLENPAVRHLLMLSDLGVSVIRGLLADDVRTRGLTSLDGEELSAWLRRHGATNLLLESSLLRSLYDAWFAYREGVPDAAHRDIAAGVGVATIIRTFVLYQGALLHVMTAGMGDVVITPIYEVLVKRGVRFEFFSDVKKLRLSPDRQRIAAVEIDRQADVRQGSYQPLISVGGVPCWPSRPLFDQLVQGVALKELEVDLESNWSTWAPVGKVELHVGRDFDDIVLGISLGALGSISAELAEANPAWRRLVERVPAIATQAVQVWFDASAEELGWEGPPRPSVGVPEPFSVWADMSHTLVREAWPAPAGPRSVVYLCGTLDERPIRGSGRSTPADARALVRRNAIEWFERYTGWIWKRAVEPGSKALAWRHLHGAGQAEGRDRIDVQFLRANIDPSERYVITPAGTVGDRLSPDGSGFENLILAGDWTRTAISAGCVEAATMSGMMASRALCGHPERVWGEHFLG